jgi:hypothetical protein
VLPADIEPDIGFVLGKLLGDAFICEADVSAAVVNVIGTITARTRSTSYDRPR